MRRGDDMTQGAAGTTRVVRPDMLLLWPTWAAFPLFGIAILALGVFGDDNVMRGIGTGLLLFNLLLVIDYAYFTTLSIQDDSLVFRSHFGLQDDRVSVGAIQRIDAKRYPAAHSGVSAPNLVVRGRSNTLKVNIKPYRLAELRELVATLRASNHAIQLDAFWAAVSAGRDPVREAQAIPRSRW
jgi:hypothetical protein